MNASTEHSSLAPEKRILFWSELYWPHVGGIETFSEQLFSALIPRGFRFQVITSEISNCPREETHLGTTIHRLPLRPGLSGSPADFKRCLDKIRQLKEEFRPDLTHLNTNGPSFLYHYLTLKIRPHPTLFTFHFDATPEIATDSLSRMLERCDRVNAVSEDTLGKAVRLFPNIREKSSVIYNGVAMPPNASCDDDPPGNLHFLCWGRLAPNKGFDVGLRAFAKFASQESEARLTIVGDGPEREPLQALTHQLGMQHRVSLPGYLPSSDLDSLIRSSTAVLMPSLEQECFGLVALEAMQRGKPVIASRYGGLAEVIEDGVTGLLCQAGNVAEFAEAIARIAAQPETAQAMGREALSRAQNKFSLQAMADAYDKLYREMISSGNSRLTT